MRSIVLILIASGFSQLAVAQQQRNYTEQQQLWFGYYNSIQINPKLAVNSDFQGRTTDWYKQWSQVLGRAGLAYKPNEKFSFTLGFADFIFFGHKNKATRNEYRPWEEISINDNYGKFKITHRLRVEQRYFQQIVDEELSNKHSFNHRFRYRFELQYPLWNKSESKELRIQFGNEIMVNAGKGIVYNYFDQNRTWAALFLTVNKSLTFQLQYINIFQQFSNGSLNRIDVIRFNIYHTINLA